MSGEVHEVGAANRVDVDGAEYFLTGWIQGVPVTVGPHPDKKYLKSLKAALERATVKVDGQDRELLDGNEVYWDQQEPEGPE